METMPRMDSRTQRWWLKEMQIILASWWTTSLFRWKSARVRQADIAVSQGRQGRVILKNMESVSSSTSNSSSTWLSCFSSSHCYHLRQWSSSTLEHSLTSRPLTTWSLEHHLVTLVKPRGSVPMNISTLSPCRIHMSLSCLWAAPMEISTKSRLWDRCSLKRNPSAMTTSRQRTLQLFWTK